MTKKPTKKSAGRPTFKEELGKAEAERTASVARLKRFHERDLPKHLEEAAALEMEMEAHLGAEFSKAPVKTADADERARLDAYIADRTKAAQALLSVKAKPVENLPLYKRLVRHRNAEKAQANTLKTKGASARELYIDYSEIATGAINAHERQALEIAISMTDESTVRDALSGDATALLLLLQSAETFGTMLSFTEHQIVRNREETFSLEQSLKADKAALAKTGWQDVALRFAIARRRKQPSIGPVIIARYLHDLMSKGEFEPEPVSGEAQAEKPRKAKVVTIDRLTEIVEQWEDAGDLPRAAPKR
jgi:hypothetical protein